MTTSRERLAKAAAAVQELKERELDKRLAADPFLWLTEYTKTYNEKWREQGRPIYAPFPKKEYIRLILNELKAWPDKPENRRTAIAKSREMLGSWICCGYMTWHCQYFPRTRAVIQCTKEETAQELLGYMRCLYDNQEPWLRRRHPLGPPALQSKSLLLWDNESRGIAIRSGADQIRSVHPTILLMDEAASMPEAQEAYATADPVVTQIILLSTAKPGFFAEIAERPA